MIEKNKMEMRFSFPSYFTQRISISKFIWSNSYLRRICWKTENIFI